VARQPFLLDPDPTSHTAEELLRTADPAGAHYDTDVQAWVTSFLMGSINTRVVRRTQALLSQRFDYQEYARFDSSTAARMALFETAPGSGLRLAIVRDLAQLYGGTITLDESSMGGLRASLRLPS